MIIDIRQMLLPIFWLMLLPWFMTNVIVMVLGQMLLPYIYLFYGRCYCLIYVCFMADVIANFMWKMLNHICFSTYCNNISHHICCSKLKNICGLTSST